MAFLKRPMTNGDYIRNMQDWEMAEIILCPHEITGDLSWVCQKPCVECSAKWLRQPVKIESEDD